MSSGSAVPMSRLSIDRNSQQQQHQQNQINTRIPFNQQLSHQISGNNNLINSSSSVNSSGSNLTKTDSVVSCGGSTVVGGSSDNLTNLTFITTSISSTTTTTLSYNQSDSHDTGSPTKKKIKVESNVNNAGSDDTISGLKKRILEHKYQRLKSVKEKYVKFVSFLLYIFC